jgi:hypothetical protein
MSNPHANPGIVAMLAAANASEKLTTSTPNNASTSPARSKVDINFQHAGLDTLSSSPPISFLMTNPSTQAAAFHAGHRPLYPPTTTGLIDTQQQRRQIDQLRQIQQHQIMAQHQQWLAQQQKQQQQQDPQQRHPQADPQQHRPQHIQQHQQTEADQNNSSHNQTTKNQFEILATPGVLNRHELGSLSVPALVHLCAMRGLAVTPSDTRERIIARLLIRGVTNKSEAVEFLKDQVRIVDSILTELGIGGSALSDGDDSGSLESFVNNSLKRLGRDRAGARALKKRSSSVSLVDRSGIGTCTSAKRRMSVPPEVRRSVSMDGPLMSVLVPTTHRNTGVHEKVDKGPSSGREGSTINLELTKKHTD